jgi:hypothetical protein
MASDLISQDVVPIGTGYLILMGVLAAGLRLVRRDAIRAKKAAGTDQSPDAAATATSEATATTEATAATEADSTATGEPGSGGKKADAVARRVPAGWPRFAVQVCATALGGYVLLMAVDVLYYYGVARVAGQFIESAFTGGLLLMGISLPLFAAASWLSMRWRHR